MTADEQWWLDHFDGPLALVPDALAVAFMLGGVPKRTSVVLAVPALLRRRHS